MTPALFVSHGAPTAATEDGPWSRALRGWAARLGRPRAAVVVSAHWAGPLAVTSSTAPKTIHDFSGFPKELYEIQYPAPGDPALARDVARRLGADLDPRRGLDHGAWVPLRHLFPNADVPVVQVSLPPGGDDLAMGRALAELRNDGVLLLGSGGAVHDLGDLDREHPDAPPAAWAAAFDRWAAERAAALDAASLARWRTLAPEPARAHPSDEHWRPFLFAMGAALPGDRVETLHESFRYGTLSLRTFAVTQ
jgi:4,5-DOPA dioxygenase extradiol